MYRGLGSWFAVVYGAWEAGSAAGKARLAASRARMYAEYEYRQQEVIRKRAEAAVELANAETKTITGQAAAVEKIKIAEKELQNLQRVIDQRERAELILYGGGMVAVLLVGAVAIKRYRGRKK